MEEKLQIVLKQYIKEVEDICNILLKNINYSENINLKTKFDFLMYRESCRKMEFEAEGISYRLHGRGCVAFNDTNFIDWDFGYRSRWCGIDPWKVSMTLKKNNCNNIEYYDGNLVMATCEHLVERGIMFKQYNQYYFKLTEDETFKPEFPKEYDTLSIENTKSKWCIPRNKVIDRFIKKSTRVHNQVDKSEDNYILRFLLNDKEVFTISYNDISYPENAVKIMSDEILKSLS